MLVGLQRGMPTTLCLSCEPWCQHVLPVPACSALVRERKCKISSLQIVTQMFATQVLFLHVALHVSNKFMEDIAQ